jgi:hypothetical protein
VAAADLSEASPVKGCAILKPAGMALWERLRAWEAAVASDTVGASGARLVTTAVQQLHASGGRYGLCTMCIGVGQGIALVIERV